MEYFLENPDHLWYLIAGISFVIELSIMGLSGPLLFFAIASLTTGILVTVGFVEGWQSEIFTVGVLTAIVAAILWKPLKSLQNSKDTTDNSSDMVGLTVLASTEINVSSGSIRYSGIDWQARLAEEANGESISAQSQCVIVAITGNIMLVKAL
ncbi:NfeD family protein [Colwellia sp. Bg11-28]|jgi:membrane protein implicated in regulation of membrane protease activity|uniref:NfeD family protein n=1 Tax=Colwellia sp. Bg11-28 TaxID=2058305 RepID=UPI000C332081|nr:NfeD family protein [Colwellia sp. Bg11-28]PKH85929.1 acriflavin resistance protein [Colwellia sp. Bg11-28]